MKKFLIATTALVATAGIANAEVAVSGAAKAGLVYNSEGQEKTRLLSSATVVFDASGESDGGLTFGFNANIIIENNGGVANDDTTVYMSGAFGKISFGAVAEADEVAGLSDIGWDGLDVDDVAEALVGDEVGDLLGQSFGHNVNYTYATGPLVLSASTRMKTSHATDFGDRESYAAGMKYSFGDYYVGLGYADHSADVGNPSRGTVKVLSAFGGASIGAIKVAALYSDATVKDGLGNKAGAEAYGLNASYTMDALTVSLGLGRANFDAVLGQADQKSIGIGAAYNLGGGASISGGIARVESVGDENLPVGSQKIGASARETRADVGVKFSF
jgi:outer membrane protein OmpU